MSKKVFYGIIKGCDIMYIQLNKPEGVLYLINRLRYFEKEIYLEGATISRIKGIPDENKDYNTVKLTLVCGVLKSIYTKYKEYEIISYDYDFNIKDNRISYDNDKAGNIIKALVDNMIKY